MKKKNIVWIGLFLIIGVHITKTVYIRIKYNIDRIQTTMVQNIKTFSSENLSNKAVKKIPAYEVENTTDLEKDKEIALEIFGFSKDCYIDEQEDRIIFSDGSKNLDVYKNTGGFYYTDNSARSSSTNIDLRKVDANKIYEKCEQILEALDIEDVSRGDIVPGSTSYTGNSDIPTITLISVGYARLLDNKKVGGFGSISFSFDSEGNIASAMVSVKRYKEVGKVPVVSAKAALNRFKDGENGHLSTDDSKSTEAIIKEAELVYWIDDFYKDKIILKPVYLMKGKTLDSDKKENADVRIITSAVG